jgi:pyruvate, orthophosphate dikinase
VPADDSRRANARRYVFRFGGGTADGGARDIATLGEKGAALAAMSRLGLPVPPGFTIATEVCGYFHANGHTVPAGLDAQVNACLAEMGMAFGSQFGVAKTPLLVSVRSGAAMTMPGLTGGIVNLGLNDATVEALSPADPAIFETYARFIEAYAVNVLGMDEGVFEAVHDDHPAAPDWAAIATACKAAVEAHTGKPFPQNPLLQLWNAIGAVYASWRSPHAVRHRTLNGIADAPGAAVTIEAMVPGRISAAGTIRTRHATTGANMLTGEWRALGSDPTSARQTDLSEVGSDPTPPPRIFRPISELQRRGGAKVGSDPILATAPDLFSVGSDPTLTQPDSLETLCPATFTSLAKSAQKLERHLRDMQEIEWAVADGQLWLLQSRPGRPTTNASLRIAVDMAEAGIISKSDALMRIDPRELEHLLHPAIDPGAEHRAELIATGLPSSPGAATGELVFTPEAGERARAQGRDAILVREEMAPADVRGMQAVVATLTTRGGLTGHAEMVARGMGRPFVSAVRGTRIDEANGLLITPTVTLREGDTVTLDGSTGKIFRGRAALIEPELTGDFAKLMTWADGVRRLKVRANADTAKQARQARLFGAEGIGLTRTEHMFFAVERMLVMREMILAENEAGRRAALAKLLPMQKQDFIELFEIMAGLPVTIRLLDPPLHEFLPHDPREIAEIAADLKLDPARVTRRVRDLSEINPMLGLRGCRLAIVHPEIVEMQARAIFEAAISAGEKTGKPVTPEIMVPLVSFSAELVFLREVIDRTARLVTAESGVAVAYQVGTMIELPRAALTAGEIAGAAEFFSFGTNDLTQTTLGLSRDDAAPILAAYADKGIVAADPFLSLDVTGVGELVRIAAERGRKTRPELKLGICGEHGADPRSIAFCEEAGLDYVSCSPFRVPIARLAAARAVLGRG